jgi:hypothetical protein
MARLKVTRPAQDMLAAFLYQATQKRSVIRSCHVAHVY